MDKEVNPSAERLGFLNILIIVLSVYVLIALTVDTLFELPAEISRVLKMVDDAICLVFLYDFLIRFKRADDKLQYMKWGWIDLISSIPTFDYARAGRALRLIRLLRILRAFCSLRHFIGYVLEKNRRVRSCRLPLLRF
ncbi:MAG: ion transporter [Saprospiraceae bacterium]